MNCDDREISKGKKNYLEEIINDVLSLENSRIHKENVSKAIMIMRGNFLPSEHIII